MEKNILRERMLEKRRNLSSYEVKSKSKEIIDILGKKISFENKVVHIYMNGKDGEVDTSTLLPYLDKAKDIITSKTSFKENTLKHYSLRTKKEYMGHIDIIIVPGIAFSPTGDRIGYGYGFYDRFLSQYPKSLTIGLSYEFQLVDSIKVEIHDIPLDHICTEKNFLSF